MPTLFNIQSELLDVNDRLDESGGELPAEEFDAICKYLDSLAQAEDAKLIGYDNFIQFLDTEAERAQAIARAFSKKAQWRVNLIHKLKSRIKEGFERLGRKRLELSNGRVIAIQANGGPLPLEVADDLDIDTVPKGLVTRELNREAVAAALKSGAQLVFAKFGERGTHLRIK